MPVGGYAVPREKTSSHVLPAVEAGKEKVARVVMSDVRPDLKIRPVGVLKDTAPLQTVYWDVVKGRIMVGVRRVWVGWAVVRVRRVRRGVRRVRSILVVAGGGLWMDGRNMIICVI